jgi:serine/threonine protein kinase
MLLYTCILHIFCAIYILSINGYVHGDIKLANIVFEQQTQRFKLIDYDFLNEDENRFNLLLKDSIESNKNMYIIWPPELYDINEKGIIFNFIMNVIDNNYPLYQFMINILKLDKNDVSKCIKQYFIYNFIKSSDRNWFEEFLSILDIHKNKSLDEKLLDGSIDFSKIDIYSFGITLYYLFSNINSIRINKFNMIPLLHYSKFEPLLKKMISPNHINRPSPLEALIEWTKILSSFTYIDFRSLNTTQINFHDLILSRTTL